MSTSVLIPDVATPPSTPILLSPPSTALVESKKSNHRANVVRIAEVLPHPDPDTTNLELIRIGGYQVVVRKGDFKVGDLGVYIQPDSVVPQTEPFRFIWEGHVGLDGTVPEKRRRITVRKFRGQWSEGLLLPVTDFPPLYMVKHPTAGLKGLVYQEDDDVSDVLGVTHYDPDAGTESTVASQAAAPRRKHPKTIKGWFFYILFILGLRGMRKNFAQEVSFQLPQYDVDAFKNHAGDFEEGEQVIVTEKVHGSNARFVCIDGVMYAGSKTQWKAPSSNDVWRKALKDNPWIEQWCRLYEGYAIYGEVTPTQKGFNYGYKNKVGFLPFDILSPVSGWLQRGYGAWNHPDVWANMAPVLYEGAFNRDTILKLVDGESKVPGAGHIREGIVIEPLDLAQHHGRRKLKIVSNSFLERDNRQ